MNRVRNSNNFYQVLLTPDINDVSSPDSSTLIGSWFEPNLENFRVLQFTNRNDAIYEALKYPDINWRKIITDHEFIYKELKTMVETVLSAYPINVQVIPKLMSPCELKNNVFDAALTKNVNLLQIITFTIISPWSKVLNKATVALLRDITGYYRINKIKKAYEKITYLMGNTPYGTTYQIKLVPSLLFRYFVNDNNGTGVNSETFNELLIMQNKIDAGPVQV